MLAPRGDVDVSVETWSLGPVCGQKGVKSTAGGGSLSAATASPSQAAAPCSAEAQGRAAQDAICNDTADQIWMVLELCDKGCLQVRHLAVG